jgi:hypothetical protein
MAHANVNVNGLYGNHESEEDSNDVYDDIAFYQHDRRGPGPGPVRVPHDPEDDDEEEESIYDDCTTANTHTTPLPNGKSAIGSYDFTNGARTLLDSDGHDSAEKIPLRPIDGIEFIGIRKIDSETHLNATIQASIPRSPSPEHAKRSSSVSTKARRKVNQFSSTIAKRVGAAFSSSR